MALHQQRIKEGGLMDKKPIRVLNIIADFKKGGIQAEVMYPARILSKDDVLFDVMLLSDTVGYYEDEFKQYGNIYRIPLKRKKTKIGRLFSIITDYYFVKKEMHKFFKQHPDYDAVHARHIVLNAPCIIAAKKAGIPVRIAHCAVDRPKGELKNRKYVTYYLSYCAKILRKNATHCFGVTKSAVEYLCGEGNGIVMKNPTIALDKFNMERFKDIVPDKNIHLIMVGSYGKRKNQKFAADILKELSVSHPNATLTYIGYPRTPSDPYLPDLKKYVAEIGIADNVRFLPQDADIPAEMAKATILLISSLQEGLPNVALEAQAMGLPCFISSDVSDECNCGICEFYPLSLGPKGWADKIENYVEQNGYDKHYVDMSEWDNYKICQDYLEYWKGKPLQL